LGDILQRRESAEARLAALIEAERRDKAELTALKADNRDFAARLDTLIEAAEVAFFNLDTRLRHRRDLWTSDERNALRAAITQAKGEGMYPPGNWCPSCAERGIENRPSGDHGPYCRPCGEMGFKAKGAPDLAKSDSDPLTGVEYGDLT